MSSSDSISAKTRICAVYGHPIGHSASPAMQNAGTKALGLDWRYVAFDVRPEELGPAIAGAKAMRFIGLNLTVPHKLLAVSLVDVVDAAAREWGAINTIRFEGRVGGGAWRGLGELAADEPEEVRSVGFNTDADAIVRSLQEDLGARLPGSKVLLLGAGGAGRTAALRIAQEGPGELWLVNRTEAKAAELAREIAGKHPEVKVAVGYPKRLVDLAVNATSLGLREGDALPIDEKEFPLERAKFVYDMIYRPAKTRLLAAAESKGCVTANGLGMLLCQGAKSLEIWSGRAAPVEAMRKALMGHVYV